MAQVALPTPMQLPPIPRISIAALLGNTTAMTATGHLTAFAGRHWNKDRATKTIVGVGLLFGSITKAGGSGLKISQQGVSTSSGPPYQPDGVEAQSWSVANGNANFATNTWLDTSDNAGVSVAFDEAISIVVEYDASGRQGADSVTLRGLAIPDSGNGTSGTVYYNGTTFGNPLTIIPDLVFKYSDGTFGTLKQAIPCSNFTTLSFNSGNATQDEAGLEFTVPAPMTVAEVWAYIQTTAGTQDYDLVLYAGTSAIATVSHDANQSAATSAPRFVERSIGDQLLSPGTTYRLMVKPTTTNNLLLHYLELSNASHRQALRGFGEAGAWTTRVDGGSFAAVTTTRVPMMGIGISKIADDTGSGSSGGVPLIGGGLIQ